MFMEFFAVSAITFGGEDASEPEGCAVAVRYAEQVLARRPGRYVFSPTASGWPSDLDRSVGADEVPVDAVFAEKINATPPTSAVEACGSLRRFLDAQAIPHSAEAVAEATWANDLDKSARFEPYDRIMVVMTLPLLNGDGSEAFVQLGVFPHPRFCAMFSYTLDVGDPELSVTRWRPGPLC
jgi:hypothetical protein